MRKLATVTCVWPEIQMEVKVWEGFIVEETEGFHYAMVKAKLSEGWPKAERPHDWYIFGFLWLTLS